MANRIEPADHEELSDPQVRGIVEQADEMFGDSVGTRVLARRPHILKKYTDLYESAVWEDADVEFELFELMRFRCADVNDCFY